MPRGLLWSALIVSSLAACGEPAPKVIQGELALPFGGKMPDSAYLQLTVMAGPKAKSEDPATVVGQAFFQDARGPRMPFQVEIPDGVDPDKTYFVTVRGRLDGIPARGCSDFVVDRNRLKSFDDPTSPVVVPIRMRRGRCNSTELMAKLDIEPSAS